MNTAVVNVKTDPVIKSQAQKIASELGFTLSALINGYIRHLVKTKTVYFSAKFEEPSEYLMESLKAVETDIEKGRISPSFSDAKKAIRWLNNPKRKFLNES